MTHSDQMTLGALLRGYRERQGLTQEELAERAGPSLSVNTVSNVERGRTRPYRHTLEALCTALALPEDERAALLAAWRGGAAVVPVAVGESSGEHPSALPVPLTPLLGREREEAALVTLVGCQNSRTAGRADINRVRRAVRHAPACPSAPPSMQRQARACAIRRPWAGQIWPADTRASAIGPHRRRSAAVRLPCGERVQTATA